MFGWLFKKKEEEVILDTSDEIYLNNDGSSFYPLTCDPYIYSQSLESIRVILLRWIKQDRMAVDNLAIKMEGTISYLLYTFDLKLLPYDIYLSNLLDIIHDTELNKSGNRLLDAIALIHTTVPTEMLECFKGKFLYSMLYSLPPTLSDGNARPTKEMWLHALDVVPWAPFILIIQELIALELSNESHVTTIIGSPIQEQPTAS